MSEICLYKIICMQHKGQLLKLVLGAAQVNIQFKLIYSLH